MTGCAAPRHDGQDERRYQRETMGADWQEHLDGVEWFMCDPPRRWHRCWPQTRFYDSRHGDVLEHCACGGYRYSDRPSWAWAERNTHKAPTAGDRHMHALGKQFDAAADEFHAAEQARDWDAMKAARDKVKQLYAAMYGEDA